MYQAVLNLKTMTVDIEGTEPAGTVEQLGRVPDSVFSDVVANFLDDSGYDMAGPWVRHEDGLAIDVKRKGA